MKYKFGLEKVMQASSIRVAKMMGGCPYLNSLNYGIDFSDLVIKRPVKMYVGPFSPIEHRG